MFVETIPTEIGQLENLAMVWLFNNVDVIGKIPTELGNLSKLRESLFDGVTLLLLLLLFLELLLMVKK